MNLLLARTTQQKNKSARTHASQNEANEKNLPHNQKRAEFMAGQEESKTLENGEQRRLFPNSIVP